MPLYDFECRCGERAEHILSMGECDQAVFCEKCKAPMRRVIIGAPALHGEPYHMGVVLSDGTRMKGRFGKADRLCKRSK